MEFFGRARQAKENYLASVNGEQVELAQAGQVGSSRDATTGPTGTIIAYAADTAPEGYLICDGSAVSRTTYSALFNIIGTKYGDGDGSTTFNLPNFTNIFLKGGTSAGVHEDAGLPNITGTWRMDGINASGNDNGTMHAGTGAISTNQAKNGPFAKYNTSASGNVYTGAFNASWSNAIYGKSSTVTPENISVLYCIKY